MRIAILFRRCVPVMRWMYKTCPAASAELDGDEADVAAASDENTRVLTFLLRRTNPMYQSSQWVLAQAAKMKRSWVSRRDEDSNGDLEVLKLLFHHRATQRWAPIAYTRALDTAAEHGALPIFEFLLAKTDSSCTTAAMNRAAEHGHLAVVAFLHAQSPDCVHGVVWCTTDAMDLAAANGYLETAVSPFELHGGLYDGRHGRSSCPGAP